MEIASPQKKRATSFSKHGAITKWKTCIAKKMLEHYHRFKDNNATVEGNFGLDGELLTW